MRYKMGTWRLSSSLSIAAHRKDVHKVQDNPVNASLNASASHSKPVQASPRHSGRNTVDLQLCRTGAVLVL